MPVGPREHRESLTVGVNYSFLNLFHRARFGRRIYSIENNEYGLIQQKSKNEKGEGSVKYGAFHEINPSGSMLALGF